MTATTERPAQKRSIFTRLYHGETDFDFIGRWKLWFAISGTVILLGLVAFIAHGGLNLGIDFTGGNVWQIPANGQSVSDVEDALERDRHQRHQGADASAATCASRRPTSTGPPPSGSSASRRSCRRSPS